MSTRQKSFLDQNTKPKPFKGQWNRTRNATGPYASSANPSLPRQVVTGPPIMPSSQTRRKIKGFQFLPGAPSEEDIRKRDEENRRAIETKKRAEAEEYHESQTRGRKTYKILPSQDKENVFTRPNEISKVLKTAQIESDKPSETPKLEKSYSCPIPSTPATRLPLADLISNADDTNRQISQPIESPDEQLGWRCSQSIKTPLPRKRKRSRSSAGSSQEEVQFPSITEDMNTPQQDPADELWSRYRSTKGTPSIKKGIAFAHLLNDPSPRSSANTGSVSGLRRWASCGVEFPASTSKKRRTHGTFRPRQDGPDDVFNAPSSDSVFKEPPPKSRLAGMLEEMRESVSRPHPKTSSSGPPSSSSPLPEAGDRHIPPSSPLQDHGREDVEHAEDMVAENLVPNHEYETIVEPTRSFSNSSDEFGGDDFDVDMVEALEISQVVVQPPAAPVPIPQANAEENTVAWNEDDSDDEFGLNDDFCAADLEHVASLYDARSENPPSHGASNYADLTHHNEQINHSETPIINLVDDEEEDFGDDIDLDDFAVAEVAATQGNNANSQHMARAIQRYLIKNVSEGSYKTDRGLMMPEKILLVEDEKSKLYRWINLRQSWFDSHCTPESYVHVIGEFPGGRCTIDDKKNMLILHPDHLISATVVADSFSCLRRAVLQNRIKATSQSNEPMLYGTLLHELFQEALKANRWDTDFLMETIDKLLPSKFETILEINLTCERIKEHMSTKLPELQSWAKTFVRARPSADAAIRERNGRQSIMSINKLLDVEEHVWSPMYGLKGNIDATVQVTMQDNVGERTLTVPFEVKTGTNSSNTNHVAQTALYTLLLSNRYDIEVAYGILYYMETSDISRIPSIRNDLIHMIIKRNELACYVRDRIELPPMLKEDFKCGSCYARESCFIYNKLVEDGNGDLLSKKAKLRYDELAKPLKPSDQAFLKNWDSLLTKEESDMMKFRRELWTMLSEEREKLGRCFSNVILEPGSGHELSNGQKINRYSYAFTKQRPKPGFSFTESQLAVGEPVVVSDEEGHFALANGYVTNVKKHRITVAVDRRLHNSRIKLPGFHSQTNQTFVGIMEVSKEGEIMPQPQIEEEPVLYRLDKDEFSNGMAAARNNLVQIMDDNVPKASDLRSLIVDRRAPVFKPESQALTSSAKSSDLSMNDDQKAAITKVLTAEDYALVLGMPGTGKTTTIAHIIRTLVARKKSVLLTSYTHTAVDNILLKFRNDNINILRLGAAAKIHPEVREFAILGSEPKDSLEELHKSWMEPLVVATTCLTINHPLFNRRQFDYCIVDEASQITLPVCLGPIRMANTFILVGDHYQLPPLVQNRSAAEGGLDVSLFKMLCEAHPQAVVSLEHQYRMCADIMLLSNTFIYSGRLKCGTPSVASRQLQMPNPTGLLNHHYSSLSSRPISENHCSSPQSPTCWLSHTLSPSNAVVFINTDRISHELESQSGRRIINTLEARLITHLTVSLLSTGISPDEIGIIAFYRSQLALLRQSLTSAHTQTQSSKPGAFAKASDAAFSAVELHTADKFQGRDKEVVLVSCVRSNNNDIVGDLLKDARRVNVALTRARSKMVLVGSEKTLSSNELLCQIVQLCRDKGWVLDLDASMVDSHMFDEGAPTQTDKSLKLTGINEFMSPTLKKCLTPSPSKKRTRAMLGDITGSNSGIANIRRSPKKSIKGMRTPSSSPEKMATGRAGTLRTPGKVFKAGKRELLDGEADIERHI